MPANPGPQPRQASGRPRGADSNARRAEILAEAARLFAQQGYRGVSMSAVARASGMSLTGLVHHFPGKDDLLRAVLEQRDTAGTAPVVEPEGSRQRGWAYVEAFAGLAKHNEKQPHMVKLYASVSGEAVDPGHPASPWLRGHFESSLGALRAALGEAVLDGELSPDAPVESMARLLVAAMDGLQVQWLAMDDYSSMVEEMERLVALLRAQWGISAREK